VLVSETWPAQHRAKAIGIMQSGWALGYILAAVLAGLVLPTLGWRWLFVVGASPALLVVWVRHAVAEPEVWHQRQTRGAEGPRANPFAVLFGRALIGRTLLATMVSAAVMFAYWGLFTWMPNFLARPAEEGGAGLSLVKSVGWLVPMQLGAFCGYLSFGFLADWWGRRRTFVLFLLSAALIVPVYGQLARAHLVLMVLGPVLGFVGHGYFSLFGAMLAELFPTPVRATGQGLTYNGGRALSALAPFTIGALADVVGIGSALALTSAFFLLGAVLIFLLPDTTGTELS
jgi:MFS family permease